MADYSEFIIGQTVEQIPSKDFFRERLRKYHSAYRKASALGMDTEAEEIRKGVEAIKYWACGPDIHYAEECADKVDERMGLLKDALKDA